MITALLAASVVLNSVGILITNVVFYKQTHKPKTKRGKKNALPYETKVL